MTIQDIELAALIKAGVFRSKKEAVAEALRLMFATRPQLRLEAAIQLFKDEAVTLGRAEVCKEYNAFHGTCCGCSIIAFVS